MPSNSNFIDVATIWLHAGKGGDGGERLRQANRVMYRGTMRASSPTELAGVLQSALYLATLLPRFPACSRLWAKEKSEPHGPPWLLTA